MKRALVLSFIVLVFVASKCRDKETQVNPQNILTANNWKLDRFSDTESRTLTQNQLNPQAIGIFGLDIQFRSDNVTRAIDRTTKIIVNSGTWALVENNKYLDIDVIGIKDRFELIMIQKDKLIIRAKNNKQFANLEYVNLELVPAL